MKITNRSIAALVALAGLAVTVAHAGAPTGQHVINISGATLFENFFTAPASTNDYLDVDGNGVARIFLNGPQQLAPTFIPPAFAGHWYVQYRAVGSGNGVGELFTFGQSFATTPTAIGQTSATLSAAYVNRSKYFDAVLGLTGPANTGNPGAAPLTTTTAAPFSLLYAAPHTGSGGGIRVDLAIVDVPTAWFVRTGGTTSPIATPGAAGYGGFAGLSRNKDGVTNTQGNLLRSLTQGATTYNLYKPSVTPNANTIFDTPIASATIGVITNLGTGMRQIDTTDLRYLTTTGRTSAGENLMFVTRDAGSGTRNGFCNSIGIDPSWGVGENIGVRSTAAGLDLLGPDFIPSYKGGSGSSENTVANHRLAIGYAGTERAVVGASYLSSGKVELLAVRNSLAGGTVYTRPDIDAILDNGPNGYNISGPETFASIGDPRNQNEIGGDAGNTFPRMANPQAAAYLNNITKSIAAFVTAPGSDQTVFTPGEFLASQFILVAATDFVPNPLDPKALIANPIFNQNLQDYTRGTSIFSSNIFRSFGTVTLNGKVPARTTGVTYSDGIVGGGNYIDVSGSPVNYGTNLSDRNRVCGDFNGDGLRNINDVTEMMKALRFRQTAGSFPWTPLSGSGDIFGAPGSTLVIEILGDFNGDGSFDRHDIRYFADGLAIAVTGPNAGKLDRKAGFTAVDNAWMTITGSGNFFGTVLATGKAYQPGDARGDVSNSTQNLTVGFAPIGAEGPSQGTNPVSVAQRNRIDAADIDHVYAQFKRNPNVTDGELNWSSLNESIGGDLSCDITGDLKINQADVDELVTVILGTRYGDVNLDGQMNCTDKSIIASNLGQSGANVGWAMGDLNGDGIVDAADMKVFNDNFRCQPADIAADDGTPLPCDTAAHPNGGVNEGDYNSFFQGFFSASPNCDIASDDGAPLPNANNNGGVNEGDYNCFFQNFFNGCPC